MYNVKGPCTLEPPPPTFLHLFPYFTAMIQNIKFCIKVRFGIGMAAITTYVLSSIMYMSLLLDDDDDDKNNNFEIID